MQSLLEELYDGNIHFSDRGHTRDARFAETEYLIKINHEKLVETLTEPQKERFEKYCDARDEMEALERFSTFSQSLRFGVLLMAEVYLRKNEWTDESW